MDRPELLMFVIKQGEGAITGILPQNIGSSLLCTIYLPNLFNLHVWCHWGYNMEIRE